MRNSNKKENEKNKKKETKTVAFDFLLICALVLVSKQVLRAPRILLNGAVAFSSRLLSISTEETIV